MKVKDMMHKGVECVSPEPRSAPSPRECASSMSVPFRSPPTAPSSAWSPIGTLPSVVWPTTRAFHVKAKDVMTSGVVYCRDNEDIEDAVHHEGKADPQAAGARRGDADGR